MTLNSIYSLTGCCNNDNPLSEQLSDKFISGFVHNHKALYFLTCQTRKYPPKNNINKQVWTILSSASFAKRYKAPQEFLSDETVHQVSTLLLQAVEESLALTSNSLVDTVLERRLQLWGAAVPLNVWKDKGFLYNGEYAVGVCGDWLVEPSIAGAWQSGKLLADYMVTQGDDDLSLVGLDGSFHKSQESSQVGIGSIA